MKTILAYVLTAIIGIMCGIGTSIISTAVYNRVTEGEWSLDGMN